MAGRAIWKGVITFGTFAVSVKFHTAVHEERLQFNLLHDNDEVRLQQKMVCPIENQPVPREHQTKGFQVSDYEYVIMEPDELEALEPEAERMIEVMAFTPIDQIDPRYFSRSYLIGADKQERQYALLAEALKSEKSAAICQWVMRKKSYLGALTQSEGLLVMTTLNRYDEIVPVNSLELPSAQVSDKELATAKFLIETLAADFEPEKYQNEYQDRLRNFINLKAQGKKVRLKKPREKKATESEELLSILEASLEKARQTKKAA